ncbi:MAG: hypothetical protein ACE5H7_14005 [Acidiferrobacterales bacterium]
MIAAATRVFIFVIVILSPAGVSDNQGDIFQYDTAEKCENVRSMYQSVNRGLPGFRISNRCSEVPALTPGELRDLHEPPTEENKEKLGV